MVSTRLTFAVLAGLAAVVPAFGASSSGSGDVTVTGGARSTSRTSDSGDGRCYQARTTAS